ncbi:hypothetical protein [Luteimonas sp. 3794]|nr:hypothetical protein [Luteimonas sp. 3794]MDR6989958.1 outer membrane receptor for monomeric catechols [Luteimonas sp. 3794]
MDLLLNIDNVTDRRYVITDSFSQIYPQAPRTALIPLTKRW